VTKNELGRVYWFLKFAYICTHYRWLSTISYDIMGKQQGLMQRCWWVCQWLGLWKSVNIWWSLTETWWLTLLTRGVHYMCVVHTHTHTHTYNCIHMKISVDIVVKQENANRGVESCYLGYVCFCSWNSLLLKFLFVVYCLTYNCRDDQSENLCDIHSFTHILRFVAPFLQMQTNYVATKATYTLCLKKMGHAYYAS